MTKNLKTEIFDGTPEGNREAGDSIIAELESAIANVRSGLTSSVALVQVQWDLGHNVIDLMSGPRDSQALLAGLQDAWERTARKARSAAAKAEVVVVWVDDPSDDQEISEALAEAMDPKGTLQ